MNRLGRGYGFEALLAKILIAEGAFKYEKNRPYFQRREPRLEGAIMYRMICDFDDGSTQQMQNYGVDISIVAAMIERGLI